MSKKTKKKEAKKAVHKRAPGERFEGVKKLLATLGFKTKAKTSKTVCNALDCKVKLPVHGKVDGQPISRARWCDAHRKLTNQARNYYESLRKRGQSVKKLPPNRYDVRGGKLTLWARLHGVNEEKALAEYKKWRKGRAWFGLEKPSVKAKKGQQKAAKKVAKKLTAAAKKVVKAVAKPAAKKVPAPKVGLHAMKNGKGADVQAAVAAHIAKKAAESKA